MWRPSWMNIPLPFCCIYAVFYCHYVSVIGDWGYNLTGQTYVSYKSCFLLSASPTPTKHCISQQWQWKLKEMSAAYALGYLCPELMSTESNSIHLCLKHKSFIIWLLCFRPSHGNTLANWPLQQPQEPAETHTTSSFHSTEYSGHITRKPYHHTQELALKLQHYCKNIYPNIYTQT